MSKKSAVESEFVEAAGLTSDLAEERVVDLSDFAEEPGGPLRPGWYKAEVLEGYATRSGKQFATSDSLSQAGDSRNLRLCFKVAVPGKEPRNIQKTINYRTTDFTPERLAVIKEARQEFSGVQGRWPNVELQRSSLAVAQLGQVGKATGVGVPLTHEGNINASRFVGKKLDVRLTIDKNSYNDVTAFAASSTFTKAESSNGKASA